MTHLNKVIGQQKRRQSIREKRGEYLLKLGNKCSKCGVKGEYLYFCRKDMTYPKADDLFRWSRPRIDGVIHQYFLLCRPHKIARHKKIMGDTPPHGTLSRYGRYKCRCTLCRTSWRMYQDEYYILWRARKRKARELMKNKADVNTLLQFAAKNKVLRPVEAMKVINKIRTVAKKKRRA